MKETINLLGDWAPSKRAVTQTAISGIPFVNIEGPILKDGPQNFSLLSKAGPHLSHLNFPNFNQVGIAILANNHLLDYEVEGYKVTAEIIRLAGWMLVGAGLSKKEAFEPVIFDWHGKRVGIVARCETQFGLAQEKKPGVAGFDNTIYQQIRQLKQRVDIVVASIHAAAEMLPWPSPKRQETWRALVDAGADIVHGHHAHVPQGWEEYNGGWIFYGLGNFSVDPAKWSWHPNGLWSLVPEISLIDDAIHVKLKTTVIEDRVNSIHIRQSTSEEAFKHFEYLKICNNPLEDRLLLEGLWQEASVRMYDHHYENWLGFEAKDYKALYQIVRSTVIKFVRYSLGKKLSKRQSDHLYLLPYHLFACESHCDAISTALGLLGGEINDLRSPETKRLVDEWMLDR
jgi:hypothetical protein